MNKKRKRQALAVLLISALAFSHLQAVDASTVNKAKNAKKKAEEELNQANQQIEAIEKQQSVLNRVEYVSDVYEYDRNLLTQYQITVQQVADLKVNVETEKAELEAMQEEYAAQQTSLETILAQKREQMGSYDKSKSCKE